jgi:hypothetical protein
VKKARNRIYYFFILAFIFIIGLSSRSFKTSLPVFVADYAGDFLWALMVFVLLGLIFNRAGSVSLGVIALLFSFAIEFSQLYHAPWIDSIRATKIGGLVLGFTFLWSDLICYAAGITLGVVLELVFQKRE